jgi:surfeit locus 1 family protein
MSGAPRVWPVAVTAACAIAVLLALGVWQLQRLQWKEDLLTEIVAKLSAEPVTLETALASESTEFVKVVASGKFIHQAEARLIAVFDGGPGWEIITPLATEDGRYILVDRGIAPDAATIDRPSERVELLGILRGHQSGRGPFVPDNDPAKGQWYWWDVPAMLQASNPPPGLKQVPVILHLLPQHQDRGFPQPVMAAAGLTNNHLQYAITWFSLALVLLAVAGIYIRGLMNKTGA